jgi:hypothetical protein
MEIEIEPGRSNQNAIFPAIALLNFTFFWSIRRLGLFTLANCHHLNSHPGLRLHQHVASPMLSAQRRKVGRHSPRMLSLAAGSGGSRTMQTKILSTEMKCRENFLRLPAIPYRR